MFKSYFKIAWRNITRHKAYSALNIAGLSIGMACSILILLWVQNELSYDRFNRGANQIFRLTASSGDFKAAVSPAGMAEALQAQLPQIKATTRLSKPSDNLFEVGNQKFVESRVFFADSNFLQVFSYPLVQGDARTALRNPNGVLVTETTARKYFGKADAMGRLLRVNNSETFTVAGVLADAPANSQLQFDIIFPMSTLARSDHDLQNKVWGNFNFYTYLLLNEQTASSPVALAALTQRIVKIHRTHLPEGKIEFYLQPLTDIHLHSDLQIDLPGHGNIQYVNIFFIVAVFILAVACINFMNLATARSARRAKEVGLRKVVGAARFQIILQFLGESFIICFISLLIAVGMVALLLPFFNYLAGKQLAISLLDGKVWTVLIGIALLTGIVSGSYPALFLSGFKPVKVLKGTLQISNGNLLFRNTLVVMQFAVAIILLAGTAVVYVQLNFIKNKDLGFDKSNLLYVPMTGEMYDKQSALKTALQQNPLTADFSIISNLPTALTTGTTDIDWPGRDPNDKTVIPSIDVDEHFTDVFKTKMLVGRSFSGAFRGDSSNYVINETAMHVMGMNINNAVGKSIRFGDTRGTVIGVVKDFNFKSLQYAIEPLVLRLNKYGGMVMVRTGPNNTEAALKALATINHTLNPAYPFSYHFLDADLDNLYHGEQQMGSLFNLFAILAIFISCLGLYGLSAFLAEQRTKEIGVRKVLGASVFGIVYLLSANFTRLILIAVVVAVPVSWLAINNWLKGFAYHIDVSWVIFFIASVVALLIAWATVSYESIKAAIANPVKSLRTE
ncbi:MAG: ABC transporter permease [Williamsia sp.]|nr:ABC transporter permease [Williamsia sp.]